MVESSDELGWRLRGAEGEWYERQTISQDLPQLATDALVAGWDTPALRLLAGEPSNAYPHDLADLFTRALTELGRPTPGRAEARWAFVQYLAWMIVTDRVTPIEGARRMERIHYWDDPEVPEVGHMSVLVDEWEGQWTRTRGEVEDQIRRLAVEILSERTAPESA